MVVLAALALAAPAAARTARLGAVLRVEGSNGVKLQFAGYGREGATGQSGISAYRNGIGTDYGARGADMGRRSFAAEVGGIGAVDMRFHAESRKRRSFRFCEGHVTVLSGSFRGLAWFEGEGGYSEAMAHRATGKMFVDGVHDCREPARPPKHHQGEPKRRQVALATCRPGTEDDYYAFAARAGHGAFHLAERFERRDGMWIWRQALVERPARTFTFARDLSSATLAPGDPFSGTGSYADHELTGDLATSFLGAAAPVPAAPAKARLTKEAGLSASIGCDRGTSIIWIFPRRVAGADTAGRAYAARSATGFRASAVSRAAALPPALRPLAVLDRR
jgi:hypothetical protein